MSTESRSFSQIIIRIMIISSFSSFFWAVVISRVQEKKERKERKKKKIVKCQKKTKGKGGHVRGINQSLARCQWRRCSVVVFLKSC